MSNTLATSSAALDAQELTPVCIPPVSYRPHWEAEQLELLASGAPRTQILASIARDIEAACEGTAAFIGTLRQDGLIERTGSGVHEQHPINHPIPFGQLWRAMQGAREPLLIADLLRNSDGVSVPEVARLEDVRRCWFFPVRSARGFTVAGICVVGSEPATNDPWQVDFVLRAVRVVAVVTELQVLSHSADTDAREQQLRHQLTNVLERITDAFFAFDDQWRMTYVNSEGERLSQRTCEELIGRQLWDVFPQLLGTKFEQHYRRSMAKRVAVSFEEFYEPLSVWLDARVYPTLDGVAVYLRDITESHVARMALLASEANFRELAENIQEVFYSYDPRRDRMLYMSPSYETLWGRSCESAYRDPRSYLQPIHPDDRPHAEETHRRQLQGEATDIEYRIIRPDGEIRWVHDRAYAVCERDGSVKRIVGTAQDISERKRAYEQLRSNEERFRLVCKATNDAIWEWHIPTNALWWNDGFESLFGFKLDQLGPTLQSWTDHIHPDDRQIVLDGLEGVLESGSNIWTDEYRFARENGTYAHVQDRGWIIRDENGIPVRMIGGMTDITERRQLEAQLAQSQRMDAIGQLAGGIAHDFNNLLMVIFGCGHALLDAIPNDDDRFPMVEDVCAAARRGAALTKQLLEFSRKQARAPQVVWLNSLVEDLGGMLRRIIGEDIDLDVQLAPDLKSIMIDPAQIEQVLVNLAVNSRDAMPRGGRLTIRTENVAECPPLVANLACDAGGWVALSVSDTGCGISEEVLPRIFEPFFTTKEAGQGTGLGLATVYGIVKQSEGDISVDSECGAGTTFRIVLPAVDEEPESVAVDDEHGPRGSETVLLVEDDADVRRLAASTLRIAGYVVLEAKHGVEALDAMISRAGALDLLIADVVMPGMSGAELARHLRNLQPQLKVLFISGYNLDALQRHGVRDGVDVLLHKPFSPNRFLNRVRRLLDGKRAQAVNMVLTAASGDCSC